MQIGKAGDLQEWLEDWPQKEKSHRHISHLYGPYPGNQISVQRNPGLALGCRKVLEQRGLSGNGWSSAWKMACWARLYEPGMAMENFTYYIRHYCTHSLFAICSRAMQVDGALGVTAAVAEMLIQSHESEIHLLPALPEAWHAGKVHGIRVRCGLSVDIAETEGKTPRVAIFSRNGGSCRLHYRERQASHRLSAGEILILDDRLQRL